MALEILGISVLWLFLFGYVIVASIDFGAGFFNAYSLVRGNHQTLTKIIKRYLSPVWEITNVFLVFFFVGVVGFFPQTAYYYGTVLIVPASIALILLAIRGSYYAFEAYSGVSGHKGYALAYGVAGLFIPAAFSVVLTISEGGFVNMDSGHPKLDYGALLASPLSWSIVVLSVVAVLYISAVFLTWYANKAGERDATEIMRKYVLIWAGPLIISAFGIIIEMRQLNNWHYENMLDVWWLFALSGLLFMGTVYFIYKRKHYNWALTLLIVQFALAFFAYGVSHYPYLLYPHLTIYDSFTNEAMAIALVIVFIAGLALLLPSLYLVFRLFVFNKEYVSGKSDHHV
ncbi:cytochrome d ubiquinol oxidase subunit II [Metasolibacillus sp. FSL H7-0170]|uniref:cytochrome d ubiquinol oxidase subunit II n=1 Tax=Metasolibacillus TaxID=2703677 RepID=UPI000D391193|nr:cytochrome d ubiquinol oxidase subunit II [Metasolibacillus fluoroglycofenilyticus]